ncbi:DNA polymerase IV [Fusobacterium sp. IOR10]|uniref:DNA polymerase IV n=1 Tax=Fusobacterium sp. IOR10 TaxID=2665157 RepID=UPI0013D1F303|nr:DNA polymerase IV [Fusobacterium sp. IOR10]
MKKIIVHYDMDSFYASIEMRDNEKYKNRPLVVAGGVVTTANYMARKFGLHSAMSTYEAKKLCPNLVVVPVNKKKYSYESNRIHELVLKITHKIEFIALDEGYIDMTDVIHNYDSIEKFGEVFRKRIFEITGLTCSIGIGFNKLTAKIASDINKPGGQYIFKTEEEFTEYMKDKSIRKIQGVGKKFEKILNKNKIYIVEDILKYTYKELVGKYGESRGKLLYLSSRGIDHREVKYNRPTHSIGNESTFSFPISTEEEIAKNIDDIYDKSFNRVISKNFLIQTVSIKVRYDNMKTISKSKTISFPTKDKEFLRFIVDELLETIDFKDKKIRLLGISFKNLVKEETRQLKLKMIR